MYEDLVGKKEESLKVTKSEGIKYDIEIINSYINNELDTVNLDPSMLRFCINNAVILPRTFEFYNSAEEDDLVAVPRKLMESLFDDRENLENELIYYKHICENLQRQLTGIEMENIAGKSAQRIVVDDPNQISLKSGSLVIKYPFKNDFKSTCYTESFPDDKLQARFFGEPIKDSYPEEELDDSEYYDEYDSEYYDEYSRKGHELCFR